MLHFSICHTVHQIIKTSNHTGSGSAFDYTVTRNTITIAPGRNDFATVTVRVDGIALELDETFRLKLVANPPPPRIFCLDTLDLVIEDKDVGMIIILSSESRYIHK